MSRLSAAIVLTWALCGCASTGPDYRASSHPGGYGYSDTQLGSNRYQVTYVTRGSEAAAASDLALRRAAELTLLRGQDWFQVASRDVIAGDSERAHTATAARVDRVTTTDCGLLACSSSTRPVYRTGVQVHDHGPGKSTARLEFLMGSGKPPNGTNVYDAQDLADTLDRE